MPRRVEYNPKGGGFGSFEPLPEGWYHVKVNSAEIQDGRGGLKGTDRLALGMEIQGSGFSGRWCWADGLIFWKPSVNNTTGEMTMPNFYDFRQLMWACDPKKYPNPRDTDKAPEVLEIPDPEYFVGKHFYAEIVHRVDRNNPEKVYDKVKHFRPLDEPVPAPPSGTDRAATTGTQSNQPKSITDPDDDLPF